MKKSILAASLFTIGWTQTNFGMFNYVRQVTRQNIMTRQRQLCSQTGNAKSNKEMKALLAELQNIKTDLKSTQSRVVLIQLWCMPAAGCTLGATIGKMLYNIKS